MDLMSTPTSREQRPKAQATVADTIAALQRGDFRALDLVSLSDLSRADASALARVWAELPEEARIDCVRFLAELAENNVEYTFGRALRIALDDESQVVRQLAVAALWEDEGSDLIDRFLGLLESDPSQDVRAEAAQALAVFAEQAASDQLTPGRAERLRAALLAAAQDTGEPYLVRRRALESLAVFGGQPDIVALIAEAYDEDDAGLRAGALYAMGRSHDRRWLATLLAELDSADAEMRYESARACGHLGDERAVPDLARLTTDEDVQVRHAAIAALGKIGGPSSIRVLRALSQRASAVDAEAVADALEEALTSVDALRVPT